MDPTVLAFVAGVVGQAAATVVRLQPILRFADQLMYHVVGPRIGRQNLNRLIWARE